MRRVIFLGLNPAINVVAGHDDDPFIGGGMENATLAFYQALGLIGGKRAQTLPRSPYAVGCIGSDYSKRLHKELRSRGFEPLLITVDGTTRSADITVDGVVSPTVDGFQISLSDIEEVFRHLETILEEGDLLFVFGSEPDWVGFPNLGKSFNTIIPDVLRLAELRGVRTAIDVPPYILKAVLESGVPFDMLRLNGQEQDEMVKWLIATDENFATRISTLNEYSDQWRVEVAKRLIPKGVFVSTNGGMFVRFGGKSHRLNLDKSGRPDRIYRNGSGDTVWGTIAAWMALDKTISIKMFMLALATREAQRREPQPGNFDPRVARRLRKTVKSRMIPKTKKSKKVEERELVNA